MVSKLQSLSKLLPGRFWVDTDLDEKAKKQSKPQKVKNRRKKIAKKKRILSNHLEFPTMLAFEPVQLCNALCFCCPYSWLQESKEYRGEKMSRAQIRSLLEDFGSFRTKFDYDGELRINPFRYSDPLICKDMDLILEVCREYRIKCALTTNGVSFHEKNTKLLGEYFDVLGKISISVIGTTVEEVKKLMGVDLERNLNMLKAAVEQEPRLRKKIRVNLRKLRDDQEELDNLHQLQDRFYNFLGRKPFIREADWLTNRVSVDEFSDAVREQPEKLGAVEQSPERFVNGCPKNIHERIEVMVNGDVVMCCDDAERHKVFGNVFEDGILSVWNSTVKKEHETIFSQQFTEEKNDLICGTCSRAKWCKK